MSVTRIADVIVPEVFNPYVIQRTAELSALVAAGIISQDPGLDALATAGGRLINMPFWADLTGADEVLSDSSPLTAGKITSGQDKAYLFVRGRAWGVNDLAKALSGDDPMGAIGDLVAAYWARREQALLLAILKGVFADNVANDSGDMVKDVSIVDAAAAVAANLISGSNVIDTAQTMGDAKDRLTAIAVHSLVESRMAKNDLITFERDSAGQITKRVFMGLTVIVDDGCPKVATTNGYIYTSYIFGQGAIGRGNGAAPVPTEMDRDSLQGDDILVNRRHSILHPRGIAALDASVAGQGPTNTEAEDAANWNRVYDRKNVRLAALKTNG